MLCGLGSSRSYRSIFGWSFRGYKSVYHPRQVGYYHAKRYTTS
ncbi:unnamed protein product [Callosobruchus maculatus]|uniref:Uncharacterized protein n=1 Tax=Callosobruchus maculatus TaxID=64391 RepID=A0A653D9X6_CALMS|nr:unnamed protein product [Callosobruchus maculatus]